MFEFSNDAVFVHDANGRILEVNHRAAEIFGMTRDELLARNVRTLHPPEEQPRLMEILERLRNQGWARFESRFVRSDGSLVDVEISTRVLDNGLTRIQGLVREIGERKAVQRTLERVGAQWRRTFDTIPDMIVLLDGGLKVLRANRALADQLGRPFDRIIGQSYFSLMYQTDRPEAGCPLVQALEDGQTGVVDHGFPAIPGRFTSTVSPFVDDGGRVVGAVVLSRDVTARKEAEAERERLIGELSRALMEVKRLSGLLPICSSCKKIRDDTGYWEQIEQYFQDRTDVLFSHGICPDCAERLYPRLARDL
jgi:PAS domain S-box-containing protein